MSTLNLIQLRRAPALAWASSTYVPKLGEPCFDTTNNLLKIGDGVNTFTNLIGVGYIPDSQKGVLSVSGLVDNTNPQRPVVISDSTKVSVTDLNNTILPGVATDIATAKSQAITAANAYTDQQILLIQLPEFYQGQVDHITDLPASSDNRGDYFWVLDLGEDWDNLAGNATWNGTDWDIAVSRSFGPDTITIGLNGEQALTVLKVPYTLSVQLNGGTATVFDGSGNKSINITPASIDAATAAQGLLAANAVPNTRTVNAKQLNANIVLTATDVGAITSSQADVQIAAAISNAKIDGGDASGNGW